MSKQIRHWVGLASFLPDLSLFIYAYGRKEALLSSQIEGFPGVPVEDVQDVSNYVAALSHGLKIIREGFPLSLRLIREIHEILLSRGRGSNKEPGEFRRSQNWIGGTRPGDAAFVPPPSGVVMECMGQLESFLHMEASSRVSTRFSMEGEMRPRLVVLLAERYKLECSS